MLDVPQNLDTILHIGAGQCEELAAYLASDANKIVLVEPNPRLANQLLQATQTEPRVQVLELAVTTDPNLDTLYVYNLPETASLYQPTGLYQLFPGLRIVAQHSVATLSPEELLQQHPLEGDHNLLVLQAPGAELSTIKALANAQKLEHLSHIWITNPHSAFYENSSRAEDTLAELKRHGYDLQKEDDSNPDCPQWQLECNPMVHKVQALKVERDALTEALERCKNELDSAKQHSSTLEQAVSKLEESELELGAALNQANAYVSQLRNAKSSSDAELAKLKEQLAASSNQSEHDVAQLKSEHEKQLQQIGEQLNQAQTAKTQQTQELQQTKEAVEARKKEVEELKKQLAGAQDASAKRTEAEKRGEELTAKVKQLEERVAAEQAAKQQAEAKQKELQDAHTKRAEAEKRIEELTAKVKQLDEQAAKQQAEAKQKELQDANTKRAEAEKRVEDLSARLEQLEARLTSEQGGQKQLDELKTKMEYLFDQQGLQLEQATNALGRHVTNTAHNTAQELEAGFQLQRQLGTDFASLAERGNRLPSTVALQLSRQLRNQPYDLVIEMGSGVTTSFLAHTLRKRAENQSDDESESTSVARYVEPSEDDLPKRIICFEHNRITVKKLENTLKQTGLAPIVSLQYAPLVACQHQGQEYLYYGFGNRMRQLAQLYENRTARIFILLNDVASDSRPDQIAALPQLLQYLSAHSLDIVVNTVHADANIINHWHQLLDARGLEYQPATEFGHHAVKLLKVNP